MFEIEKGVPIPEENTRARKYPFREMEVGDSFSVPGEKRNSLYCVVSLASRRSGRRFTVRTQPDGSVRAWRIK